MADGNPSGRHPAPASRLLPRRIHLPLQPPALPGPRTALPSPRPAGRRQRAGTVPSDHCRQRSSPALEATCVKGIPIYLYIYKVIICQALLNAIIGFAIAALIGTAVGYFTSKSAVQVVITPNLMIELS